MIQPTSSLSYSGIVNTRALGDMQGKVLEVISASNGLTDTEIAHELGYDDINKTRPRRYELYEQGLIQEGDIRRCSSTGKTAIAWVKGFGKKKKKLCLGNTELNNVIKKLHNANVFQLEKLQVIINGQLEAKRQQL